MHIQTHHDARGRHQGHRGAVNGESGSKEGDKATVDDGFQGAHRERGQYIRRCREVMDLMNPCVNGLFVHQPM